MALHGTMMSKLHEAFHSMNNQELVRTAGVVLALCLAAFLLARVLRFLFNFVRKEVGLAHIPQAPGYNWLVGHVIPLITCVSKGMGAWDQICAWLEERGPIVRFRILGTHAVAVSEPQALKRIFQTGQKLYDKELSLSYKPFLPILGTGLVTADGALWQKQRLLIGPALRTDILDDIIPIAQGATERLMKKLDTYKGTGKPIDIEEEFRLLTLQVIGEAVLSLAPEQCDKVFPTLYLPVMTEANHRVLRPYRMYAPFLPAWWQFRSRMSKLNGFLINYFRERWQARQKGVVRARPDILDRVMEAIQESGTEWNAALEQQLCFEIKTFLLAGHETSAAMLTWCIHEITQSADIGKKVAAEAQSVFGGLSAGQTPPRRDVDGMVYTLAVLKEALRKYSVVPTVTRTLTQDDELSGHKVPAGTMIACMLQNTHNMYKDPRQFLPERFMPGGEYDQFDEAVRLFMFVPFIQGPRNCLGQWLALLEARVVLGLLMKHYTFTSAKPGQGLRSPTVVPCGPLNGMQVLLD